MNCRNCGNLLQQGVMVCPYCGTPVNNGMQQPMGGPMYQQPMMQQQYAPPKKSGSALKIILGVIGGIILLVIVVAVVIVLTSKKLKCSAAGGSFTVYYTDSNIWACTTTGTGTCDLDLLQSNAKTYGVDKVISLLKTTAENSGAVCTSE